MNWTLRTSSMFALALLLAGNVWGFQPDEETVADPGSAAGGASRQARKASAEQRRAIQAAEKKGWHVVRDVQTDLPLAVRGKKLEVPPKGAVAVKSAIPAASPAEAKARAALRNAAAVFQIADPDREFALEKSKTEANGFVHHRMVQLCDGLKVVGGGMAVHCDDGGAVYQVDGKYVPVDLADATPAVAADQARAAAVRAVKNPPADLSATEPELVVWAMGVAPRLAYQIELKAAGGRWRVWVDAEDGSILLAYDDRQRIAAPSSSGANANVTGSILSGEGGASATLSGWRESNGIYYLYDKTHHWYVYNLGTSGYADNNTYAYRSSSAWGTSDRVEISAGRNFDLTQRYFSERHGRNSFDGAGIYAQANVHYGTSYVNAYWDGSDFHFGDGDGYNANPLTVLDVAAHEFTHAVTENEAGLYYYGESGALNESFSDIFGACVEFFAQSDGRSLYPNVQAGYSDWLMGEDCWLVSKSLRDMRNPRNTGTVGSDGVQPSRYHGTYWYYDSGDNGGVHYNSGVQNFFFYLLCEGGSGNNDGIGYSFTGLGLANAEQVAYRALTVYCSTYTDYAGARAAWISAAQDLNSSWVSAVEAAWAACGVTSGTSSGDAWDPGDNAGSGATTLTASTTLQAHGPHTLSATDGYDWFKCYLQSGQTYVFHTQGSSGDNYGELYSDSAGSTRVAYNDDDGGDLQFFITYVPSATGWYYLRVRGWSVGSSLQYVLNYQQTSGGTPDAGLGAALDAAALSWSQGGNLYWTAQTGTTHDGVDAAQSGAIGNSQTTWFQTTLQGPGILSFWWRVSSESGYDYQRFQLNGSDRFTRSGEGAWEQKTVVVPAGAQPVRWLYTKDGSVANGSDRSWVDQVVWSPGEIDSGENGDFDGDGAADAATFRPANANWGFQYSAGGSATTAYGWSTVKPVPADYDGDGQIDLAVYDPAGGKWYIRQSSAGDRVESFGWSATIPVPGDYDGDGVADLAVFYQKTARWYLRLTSTGRDSNVGFGWSATIPVPADYDGDGATDLAVYYPAGAKWYVAESSTGNVVEKSRGGGRTLPVPADYDGDGKADAAVFYQGRWTITLSGSGADRISDFGWSGTLPVPADYDGDGTADLAVYYPAGAKWYVLSSQTGATLVKSLGGSDRQPVLLNSLIHSWFRMR